MITNHTQLLNALIEKYKLKSYLEIGVQNPANNFDKVMCGFKHGVDPAVSSRPECIFNLTSDEFFFMMPSLRPIYDLIFIDGLHHADQVKRDFENSLRCLSDNGFIVIHDVLPENEAGTKVPRETKQWWGDVYKWAMGVCEYSGIGYKTFDIDNGCMLVWKDKVVFGMSKMKQIKPEIKDYQYDWNFYNSQGRELMNVTSTVEI